MHRHTCTQKTTHTLTKLTPLTHHNSCYHPQSLTFLCRDIHSFFIEKNTNTVQIPAAVCRAVRWVEVLSLTASTDLHTSVYPPAASAAPVRRGQKLQPKQQSREPNLPPSRLWLLRPREKWPQSGSSGHEAPGGASQEAPGDLTWQRAAEREEVNTRGAKVHRERERERLVQHERLICFSTLPNRRFTTVCVCVCVSACEQTTPTSSS